MRQFEYIRPQTIQETVELLASEQDDKTRPLAGGTDLLTLMKEDIISPQRLLDVKRLSDLPRGISENSAVLSLGALTTLAEIEASPLLQERFPLLPEAAAIAATPQLRNMATLGGNLLQRPRCWYYRSQHINCWLKGGDDCPAYDGHNERHALFAGGPCYAVHPSDLAPVLLALNATVRLHGPHGQRTLPINDFFAPPDEQRRHETILQPDELILSIDLPLLPTNTYSTYLKAMERKVWDFALVSVAAVLHFDGENIADARLALGGVAPIPWRASTAEDILRGNQPTPNLFTRAAEAALENAQPLQHNAYKIPLARNLIRQSLQRLTR